MMDCARALITKKDQTMNEQERIEYLSKLITPERYAKMLRVLDARTRRLTVILEDIYQEHNASAVLRSCDAFGMQDVHIIENRYTLKLSKRVDMGTSKWQTIHYYKSAVAKRIKGGTRADYPESEEHTINTRAALEKIKAQGYFIAASALDSRARGIEDIPVDRPLAILVGSELNGLTSVAREMADMTFALPMLGFAQSFNLSVFSAICLSRLSAKMREFSDAWKMSEAEKQKLLLEWLELCAPKDCQES